MVDEKSRALDRVFHALADPTRREILRRVARQAYTVSELAEPFEMSLAAVSKHIKVLEKAALLQQTVEGRIRRCRLNPAPLRNAAAEIASLEQFWDRQLAALDAFLAQSNAAAGKSGKTTKRSKK
ncbi:MAG: winged helix-turn-helix transcriptional regulator [Chloroflexi bacterium]|nr:winged helix-turn-helix transcriptional regulator [Chloroflexota bacterium]